MASSASCQPWSADQRIRIMCSVKIRPKPGSARRRSLSAAGRRLATGLSWNLRAEVRELTASPTLTRRGRLAPKRPGLATRPRERKEGVLSWLELRRRRDRDGLRRELDRGRPDGGHDGQDRLLRPLKPPPSRGRLTHGHGVQHLPELDFQEPVELVHL